LRRRFPIGSLDDPERKGRIQIVGEYVNILNKVEFDAVEAIAEKIIKRYCREEIDGVYLVFNEFKSVISQRVIVQRILPVQEIGRRVVTQAEELSTEARERMGEAARTAGVRLEAPETSEMDREAVKFATAPVDYIYEQPEEELLNGLLPRYVAIQLYQSLLESVAAEHAARMTAMDAATNNANDVIDTLTLTMNRVRQAAITKEIIEIVSGAAAL
jgi:F-type H+-transporting ATPase subunit gamma